MHILKRIFLAASIAGAAALPAAAETIAVPANKTSTIGFYYTYVRDTCHSGNKPKVVINRPPEHGTIRTMWKPFHMGKEARNCAGKKVYGTFIIYTPHKGYRGTDMVKFTLSGSGVHPGVSFSLGRGFRTDIDVK